MQRLGARARRARARGARMGGTDLVALARSFRDGGKYRPRPIALSAKDAAIEAGGSLNRRRPSVCAGRRDGSASSGRADRYGAHMQGETVMACRGVALAPAVLLLIIAAPHHTSHSAGSLGGPAAGLRGSLAGPGMLPGHGKSGPSRELDHLECRKCGEDLFDFSRAASDPSGFAPRKPFGLLRPTGTGQKVQTLVSDRGSRQVASSAPLVGGDEISLESGVTTGPTNPTEPGYAGPHKEPTHQTILGRKMQIHHLKNPHGREFEVMTVTNLTNYKTHGPKVAEHSWFPGYSWQIIVCAHCGHHIGWRFDRLEQAVNADAEQKGDEEQRPAKFFFGILPSEALIESTALKSKLVTHGDL